MYRAVKLFLIISDKNLLQIRVIPRLTFSLLADIRATLAAANCNWNKQIKYCILTQSQVFSRKLTQPVTLPRMQLGGVLRLRPLTPKLHQAVILWMHN